MVVSDSSPDGPAMREASAGSERGRGLRIVGGAVRSLGLAPGRGRQSGSSRRSRRMPEPCRPGRRRRVDGIPEGQPAIAGVNIRTLRQRRGRRPG